MTEIVINATHGGFGLSAEAEDLYASKSGFQLFRYVQDRNRHKKDTLFRKVTADFDKQFLLFTFKEDMGEEFLGFKNGKGYWGSSDVDRDDPILIAVVRELGAKANGPYAALEITEIPDDVKWQIEEYDGLEHVAEAHRTW